MEILDLPPSEATRLIPLLQELHALHVEHQPARYPAAPSDAALGQWLQDWLQAEDITALIAESPQGALLGYVLFGIEHRPPLPIRLEETRVMVHHITTAKAFRRMGVGQALLTAVKQRAKALAIDSIATTYAPFNSASAGLFESQGLQPVLTMAEWRA
ncbi:GNAT family N-acetyltransferase [Pseudophaeobacter flagellatus]|uniref:GNAT family N-acetyltransferase n=1 Tax=Pseudophaeobacter flagellatus TaxID=2899119 RepID=UPI001E3B1A3A|nr:GNAT family N-acetyltransferase [Pseudophaeobacter flagellatus]MCD9148910.1 GNAT family N-acetyltransferase [Pseudophaeobacter flagellatus]